MSLCWESVALPSGSLSAATTSCRSYTTETPSGMSNTFLGHAKAVIRGLRGFCGFHCGIESLRAAASCLAGRRPYHA